MQVSIFKTLKNKKLLHACGLADFQIFAKYNLTFSMCLLQETGRESISTSEQQASSGGRTDSIGGGDGDGEMREDLYEEAFARMKKAAGVSDVDEVVRRFETQEETTNHLLELQVNETLQKTKGHTAF